MAINERSNGATEVILTERALHLPKHPGQISFPGGAREDADTSLADTALREAYEEVALPREAVEVLGYLRPQWTISGYSMTPVIGYVKGDIELEADPAEVESVFTVPADFLFDADNYRHGERDIQGVAWPMVELLWQEKRIWGATAHVILRLQKLLIKSGL
ncbi:MAG: CoA pyrophosphatase [Pseudomonadota bacterium]